mmetsp:Transcript_32690/g.82686  ORF Transcript_32690/g.82686 Transcript_32690/m.82686 type:complete len:256 (-) Transcript_32690:6-773(-)
MGLLRHRIRKRLLRRTRRVQDRFKSRRGSPRKVLRRRRSYRRVEVERGSGSRRGKWPKTSCARGLDLAIVPAKRATVSTGETGSQATTGNAEPGKGVKVAAPTTGSSRTEVGASSAAAAELGPAAVILLHRLVGTPALKWRSGGGSGARSGPATGPASGPRPAQPLCLDGGARRVTGEGVAQPPEVPLPRRRRSGRRPRSLQSGWRRRAPPARVVQTGPALHSRPGRGRKRRPSRRPRRARSMPRPARRRSRRQP